MKKHFFYSILALAMGMILAGCGGGVGSESSGSSGTISMNITDAKPMLPDGVQEVLITFDEALGQMCLDDAGHLGNNLRNGIRHDFGHRFGWRTEIHARPCF